MTVKQGEQQPFGIFCAIEFGSKDAKWRQVGTGAKDDEGNYLLKFNLWPGNARQFVLRPLLSGEHNNDTD